MGEPLILYVDDDWSNRVVFESAFQGRFRVSTVAGGREALDAMGKESVAILVTDQRMPGMLGTELLAIAKERHPETIRMIITAYSDLEPILSAVNDGLVARYIVKPWDHGELEKILAWGVEAFRAGRESTEIQLRLIQTERLVTMGTLAAAVLHDLKQPLSMMRYTLDRLRDLEAASGLARAIAARELRAEGPLGELAEELPTLIAELDAGLRSSLEMLGSLQRLVDPDRAGEARESCDPGPVLEFAARLAGRLVRDSRGQLELIRPDRLPAIAIGRTELIQTLMNLLSNAAQAIARGGRGGRVTVEVVEQPGAVRFAISDDGPGMSAEILAKIGTPFFSSRPDGLGLGVSQCMRFVSRAGGRLDVKSEVGQGTVVSFAIPLATVG